MAVGKGVEYFTISHWISAIQLLTLMRAIGRVTEKIGMTAMNDSKKMCLALIAVGIVLGIDGAFCQEASKQSGPAPAAKAISFNQLGAAAQRQYSGDGISITPTAGGAKLRVIFQALQGEATPEGLWLESTAKKDAGKAVRFRVQAMALGREHCDRAAYCSTRSSLLRFRSSRSSHCRLRRVAYSSPWPSRRPIPWRQPHCSPLRSPRFSWAISCAAKSFRRRAIHSIG